MISWLRRIATKPFLSCLVAVVLLTLMLHSGFVNTEVEPEIFSPKPTPQLEEAYTRRASVNKVLLLSSVGRSGSSFLGQLLAALENSVYIYEPIRGLPPSSRFKDTTDELLRYFNCTVRSTVFQEGPSRNIIIVHFPNVPKRNQITPDTAVERCLAGPLVIIKTIRTRLKWVLTRMQRNEFDNVKVIHLVRDPRGSYISMKKLKWGVTEEEMCDHINRDLQERKAMMSLFPSRYTFVKYEDLCRDPYGQTRRLVRFIQGKGDEEPTTLGNNAESSINSTEAGRDAYWDLPKGVRDYLHRHLHSSLAHMRGPFTTVRDTSSMYQRWRWVITQEQLQVLEPACRKVIDTLGHRMFHNFTAVRNSSLSLFTDEHLRKSLSL
ncbi:carbohydrate sulfotransferase 1-like isoform X2 [Eriocheir sinensis]|uniref:carbohydrate sulfotransferase 1-like isoform X2 n=1 Tax=Eriocheir sinensis TaxID=95602 RepID=UPI0021C802E7|nr:carbohydrate sulfotransferase 1-like isoform X2 [Eriocheir sinensis]XP_050693042.1 carbohydrate sulfotransferase 1-like isoform X2 [Eriocheir sinensis]XP_050693043.1 carbohydrate sulfotransferase 1-like isoform X2 [Eriocheir sinensis]